MDTNVDPLRPNALGQGAGVSAKTQLLEVSAFLFLIVPSLVLSFFAIRQGRVGFPVAAYAVITRDLALTCLVLFFLWRNGETLHLIGWKPAHWRREVLWGIGLFIPFTLFAGLIERLASAAGLSSPSMPLPSFLTAKGGLEYFLAAVMVVIVAVSEETIFRGYLILRFAKTSNLSLAVLLSTFVFALGHGYEGTAGVVTVGVMGLLFALIYLWRRSLVAPIVMHFLQDFIGIVFLPLLLGK